MGIRKANDYGQSKGLIGQGARQSHQGRKKGASQVKSVASEALSAAAAAAAAAAGGVVLDRVAGALQKGKEKVDEAKPTGQMAAERNVAAKKATGKKSKLAPKKKTRAPFKKKSTSKARGAKRSLKGENNTKAKKKSRRR